MSIYVDFHVLQTVPPSCVNRDDTGSPKTAVYGGTTRARVSSQAWKHAMREEFKNLFREDDLGSRTQDVISMVAKDMLSIDNSLNEEECRKKVKEALKLVEVAIDKNEKTSALFFMSNKQSKAFAKCILELDLKNKKGIKQTLINALNEHPSVDIALFGRMVAKPIDLKRDATSQVAHAISTHTVQNEYDYFTAVDDLQNEDNAGAGYLGTVEFNSSTLYRYANVNMTELAETIGTENTAETIKKFAQAFICSMPTGKENTFANRTLPDAVYVTIRKDQPVNLCGAFEQPIKRSDNGYSVESEKRLVDYAEKVYKNFAAKPDTELCIGEYFSETVKSMSLPELLSELEKEIQSLQSEG